MDVCLSRRKIAILALVALVFQNTTLAILLKLTFRKGAEPYTASSVVFVTELVKLSLCSCVAAFHSKQSLLLAFSMKAGELLLFVPSCLYVIQNNLLFFGAKHLPTIVYIVCTQTKILATALMGRIILGTQLNMVQIISLFFLALGICFVQQQEENSKTNVAWEGNLATGTLGMTAVLFASLTSGSAGIVLEKIYKGHSRQGYIKIENTEVEHTIWTRNVQLSLISLPFALFGALLQNPDLLTTLNFTRGFDAYIWGVVFFQAAGGVIIAFVMKFAGNMLKCLAVAISICCCAVYSVTAGDLGITDSLVFGIFLVVTSVYTFSTKQKVVALAKHVLPK